MNYYLVKLTSTNTQVTLRFEKHSELVAYLRNMFSTTTESIVSIYIGL